MSSNTSEQQYGFKMVPTNSEEKHTENAFLVYIIYIKKHYVKTSESIITLRFG